MTSTVISLPVNTLKWAAQSIDLTIEDVARKVTKRDTSKVLKGNLTIPQAIKFAKLTGKPFGYLFLEDPPKENIAIDIPDLRTRNNRQKLTDRFFDTYKDIVFKRDWYRKYLLENGADELNFVGSFSVNDDTVAIANNIREKLNLDNPISNSARNKDDYYDFIGRRSEDIGILVFRNGVVKSNTHRALDPDEFLGFALADKIAPSIFLNAADKTAAKIFTLAHELAHLWLGESGVIGVSTETQNKIELKCNAVAAEVLVPKRTLLKLGII